MLQCNFYQYIPSVFWLYLLIVHFTHGKYKFSTVIPVLRKIPTSFLILTKVLLFSSLYHMITFVGASLLITFLNLLMH